MIMGNIRNPLNLKIDRWGRTVDKYGRVFNVDWKEFDKKRGRRNTPIISSLKVKTKYKQ